MGSVNFYLKLPQKSKATDVGPKASKKSSTEKRLIFLQYKYHGKRLVFAFGESINPDNWNSAKQRVKLNKATTKDGQHSLNDLLDNLEEECLKSYHRHKKNGIPLPGLIKDDLKAFMNQNESKPAGPTIYNLIERFISGEIKYEGRNKSPNTLKTYKTTQNYLSDFEKEKKYKISFESINLDFYNSFVSYLMEKGLAQCWSYEKEIRIFKEKSGSYKFKPAALTHVCFGCKTTENDIRKLVDSTKTGYYDHLIYRKAAVAKTNFKLVMRDL